MVAPGEVIRASDVAVQACRLTNSAVQSIANSGSDTILTFDSEDFDTDGMHSTVTNTSRITINTAGFYIIGMNVGLASAANYTRAGARIQLNGSVDIAEDQDQANATDIPIWVELTTCWNLQVGDYLQAGVFQLSSGAKNTIVASSTTPVFWAMRIGS